MTCSACGGTGIYRGHACPRRGCPGKQAVQQHLFGEPQAAVRRSDPSTSKRAAADHEVEKQRQWRLILERLHDGPLSADTAGRVIGKHRSIASSRLGVMQKRGLVEKAGEHLERSDEGHERRVLRYRLTPAGEAEFQLMFGRAAS